MRGWRKAVGADVAAGRRHAPAVLECVPYRKRDLYRPYDDLWGAQLAAAGIAFVRLDVRGSGDSEGVRSATSIRRPS